MRRVRPLLVVCLAAGALVAAAPAQGALTLRGRGVQILTTSDKPAFVLIPGNRYRFRVSYTVAGDPRIATGHTYVVTNPITGRQMDVSTKSFPFAAGGNYSETNTLKVSTSWPSGVYTFSYRLNARAVGQETQTITGARSFLVSRPGEAPGATPGPTGPGTTP